MAEERHRCQATQEGHRLCANNCGCFGSPATLNLCSKCYRDFRLKEVQASKSLLASSSSSSSSPSPAVPLPKEFSSPVAAIVETAPASAAVATSSSPSEDAVSAPQASRCTVCRKRVGLTAFRCRCGDSFCGTHRYPEMHRCGFDFKSVGKEAIARANPVVKAQKLRKI